jgi:hypothetical protein
VTGKKVDATSEQNMSGTVGLAGWRMMARLLGCSPRPRTAKDELQLPDGLRPPTERKPKALSWVATSCREERMVMRHRRFESARGFEKSLQIAIYRVRALLALATKVAPGRTPAGLSALTS